METENIICFGIKNIHIHLIIMSDVFTGFIPSDVKLKIIKSKYFIYTLVKHFI